MTHSSKQGPERSQDRLADQLTVITGMSELLLSGAFGALDSNQEKTLQIIVGAARTAGEILRQEWSGGAARLP